MPLQPFDLLIFQVDSFGGVEQLSTLDVIPRATKQTTKQKIYASRKYSQTTQMEQRH